MAKIKAFMQSIKYNYEAYSDKVNMTKIKTFRTKYNYFGEENDKTYRAMVTCVKNRLNKLGNHKHFGSKIQTIKRYAD